MKHFIILMLCFFATSVNSAEWEIAYTDDNVTYIVDKNSITKRDNYIKAWQLINYSAERTLEVGYQKTINYQSIKQLSYFDCPSRLSTATTANFYTSLNGTGEVIHNYAYKLSKDDFIDVVPDTIGEAVFDYVCMAYIEKNKSKK